ncbi:31250_t:CDS:1, partial [Racocetra persica]
EYRESLNAIFIRRAYWAMSSVHNKIFFNEASKAHTVPDSKDSIVAMLTKQDPNEVALLQVTREILEKAKREQPEKKLDSVMQGQDKTRIEKEKQQQIT